MDRFRRDILKGALGLAAGATLGGQAAAATSETATLSLLNLHTGETLRATYREAGRYLPDALAAFDKVLRDHRTGAVHAIAPQLLDLVATLTERIGGSQTVQIISGYRSPVTNAALHKASSGVATRSLHMDGKALDIRVPGVDLARLRDAALGLKLGGVGFYPASNFVHVDVGRVRRW